MAFASIAGPVSEPLAQSRKCSSKTLADSSNSSWPRNNSIASDQADSLTTSKPRQSHASRPVARSRGMFKVPSSSSIIEAIEELAQREDIGSRLETLAKRHPGASKLLQSATITTQDLSKYQKFFKEIITLLFEKTSYNRLLVDYEQLCV